MPEPTRAAGWALLCEFTSSQALRRHALSAEATMRPSRSVRDLPPESVLKRMRDKTFARAVDRGELRRGADAVGMPLLELAALVVAAQIPIADRLGIGGAPAADLPDEPAPPAPDAG